MGNEKAWIRKISKKMIYILKYGNCGNIYAIKNIYKKLNIKCAIASSPKEIINPNKIILPGVGAFDIAMQSLIQSGLDVFLKDAFESGDIDILGICVGYQLMALGSEEGEKSGLGIFPEKVKRMKTNKYPIPHMGWNSITDEYDDPLLKKVDLKKGFYFLHSYYFSSRSRFAISYSDYDGKFSCASRKNKAYGVQFHPEKSHGNGIQLLKNFSE